MALPFGVALPFSVAPLPLTPAAGLVTTVGVGQADVVNIASYPVVVPPVFVAKARK